MTTLTLQGLNLFEVISNFFKKTCRSIMVGYMVARQTEANKNIAQMLVHHGEYRKDEYYTCLAKLNSNTIKSIHEEFKND